MKKTTGDQFLVKKINKSIVLDAIQKQSPISRAKISELTGLNKATVSIMVQELINEHFAMESGHGISSGGRKPVILLFNEKAGYSIGIDLGVNYILAVLTDLQGAIVSKVQYSMNSSSFNDVFEKLKQAIQVLTDACPDSPYGIVGIGIGVPGIMDRDGILLSAPNMSWNNIHLKEMLESACSYPVVVDNEANCGALGEKEFGAGQNTENLLYISVGIGIGSGLVINNEIFRGKSGFAGEVGHVSIETDGISCSCGNAGCWELYASEQALLRILKLENDDANQDQLLHGLVKKAEEGDREVIEALQQIGYYLGVGLTNLVNLFNPEKIIIGNRISEFRKWLQPVIHEICTQRSLAFTQEETDIVFAERGVYSAALGASSLALQQFFSKMKASVE